MKFTKIKRLLVGVFSFSVACTAMAQDLIAKQAPVDVQLRAVDSIAMLKMFEIERGLDNDPLILNRETTYFFSFV